MEPGCAAKTWRTGVVLVYTVLSLHLIWLLSDAITSGASLSQALSSAFVRVSLLDYFIGSFFAAMYIHLLRGPSIICIPPTVIAVLCPLLGSWVPLMYVCAVLSHARSLRALVPGVVEYPGERKRPRLVAAFFALCLTVFVGASLHAIGTERWSVAMKMFRENRAADAIGQDVFTGFALVMVFIVVREGGFSRVSLLWIAGLVLFGNAVTCVYVMLVALRAIRAGCSFRKALLSPSASKLDDVPAESMQTLYSPI